MGGWGSPIEPEGSGGGGMGGGAGLAGAIIQVGGALYDSHQNRKAARQNTDKTIAANRQAAELAYMRDLEMWNRMNEYNSPQAQMQRFIDAGLNPHLIYGQGSSGNASSPPSYHPPDIQYRYAAGNSGAAIASALPTLMAVGTWLQNMRAGEVQIRKQQTETERASEIVDFLNESNPVKLRMLANQESIFPYQKETIKAGAEKAYRGLLDQEMEFRHRWGFPGKSIYGDMIMPDEYGGTKKQEVDLKRLQMSSQAYKNKLLEAQSSWTDLDVTNPQGLMQMVLGGVMGLAGQSMRLSTHRRPSKVSHETEEILRNGRRKIRRRSYER